MIQKLTTSIFIALLAAIAWCSPVQAMDTPAAAVGKPAPTFELQGTDGKTHKLDEYLGKIVVIHFHAIQCPWAIAYQPILSKMATEFGPGKTGEHGPDVVFLGINSNRNESLDAIKSNVAKANLPYIVLKDPHNMIADAYGAETTPHIFVIDQKGVLRYVGGIEKAPLSPDDCGKSSEQYLEPVIKALVAGSELPVTQTKSIGCGIKRESKHTS